MASGNAVGIDFGTTNSVVAYGTVATAGVLEGPAGEQTLPSAVAFTDTGALVGRPAINWATEDPEAVVRSIKREMGVDQPVAAGREGTKFHPEQVAALIVQQLTHRAETALEGPVNRAVVTVPAYFGHSQREATRRAGEIAGLEVQRLLAEPTAACLAYGVGTAASGPAETVLVYDLGGGTFDVSLVQIADGVFDVITTSGDTQLGGDDWDERIMAWLRSKIDGDVGDDPMAMARLRTAARRAKHDLTDAETATISVPYLGEDSLEEELTRSQFERLTEDLVERTLEICEDALAEVDWNAWTVDEVLLVGGATRMPMIRAAVEDFFGQVPSADVNPEEVVATGAAIQASILDGPPRAADTETPAGLTDGGASGMSESTTEPLDQTDSGPVTEPGATVLVDVIPRSLGIEAVVDGDEGRFSQVIDRNTSIPIRCTQRYRTVRDDQTRIDVRVYQGEGEHVADNEFLGEFALAGLPEAPAGEVVVSVTFEVDENGVLNVSVAESRSGRSADVTIESPFGRDEDELDRLRSALPDIRPAPSSGESITQTN